MEKKSGFRGSGLGIGYVSIMVIFVTVCLTLFAVLSLHAAGSNDAFNERSGEYLKQYYAADSKALDILAQLDSSAQTARGEFFEDAFAASAEELGVLVTPVKGGCRAKYSVRINDRQELVCEVIFPENGGFEKTRWQSVAAYSDDESDPKVWDGTFE